jgi:hypothetical protein
MWLLFSFVFSAVLCGSLPGASASHLVVPHECISRLDGLGMGRRVRICALDLC